MHQKDREVPLEEALELERMQYNKTIKAMQDMINDSMEVSATILEETNLHRE